MQLLIGRLGGRSGVGVNMVPQVVLSMVLFFCQLSMVLFFCPVKVCT